MDGFVKFSFVDALDDNVILENFDFGMRDKFSIFELEVRVTGIIIEVAFSLGNTSWFEINKDIFTLELNMFLSSMEVNGMIEALLLLIESNIEFGA